MVSTLLLPVDVSPFVVLAMWAAGVSGALAAVARWRIVGSGFVWLASGVAALLGVPAALGGDSTWAWAGAVLVIVGAASARRWALVVGVMWAAAGCFVIAAWSGSASVAAGSGALLLGAVTGEMMLGHWYLVDPRLPRRALRTLGAVGAAAAIFDGVVLVVMGAIPWDAADAVAGVGFLALSVTTVGLMVAVWLAIGETGYAGVMAATGLSYLAVLTAVGGAVLGRSLIA